MDVALKQVWKNENISKYKLAYMEYIGTPASWYIYISIIIYK